MKKCNLKCTLYPDTNQLYNIFWYCIHCPEMPELTKFLFALIRKDYVLLLVRNSVTMCFTPNPIGLTGYLLWHHPKLHGIRSKQTMLDDRNPFNLTMNKRVPHTVLVTGASGFIGRHLVRRLIARGDRVTCLVRATSQIDALRSAGAQWVVGDVTDRASVRQALAESQAETVFHLAGITTTLRKDDFQRVNAGGTDAVAAACADCADMPVLVVVSSLAAAGPCTAGRPRVESDVPAPVSAYGRSKLAGELAAAVYAGAVPICIVRPPMVFGTGASGMMELFRAIARWGVHLVPGGGEHYVSVVHVADLVEGLLLVAEKGERLHPDGVTGQGIYFMAADDMLSYADLGQAMAHALGKKRVAVVHLPGPVVRLVGLCGEVMGRLRRRSGWVNRDKIDEALAGSWTCSAAKAQAHLGWSPAAALTDRLHETANSLRSRRGDDSVPPRAGVSVASAHIECSVTMDAASIARLEAMAYRCGRSYDSYLVMDLDRLYFWSSGDRAVLGFVLKGSQAVVIGGLIGPDAAREILLTEFMDHCRRHGWTAAFGLVPEHDLPLFDRHGFQSTKIGEDALIDLRHCTWQGKAYEWVRRQSHYCQRHGLVCREISGSLRDRIPELSELSTQFLDRTPHGRTMRYFVSRFDPDRLYRRRIFAALADGGAGRAEGFIICTPYRDGAAWAIEMYRSRQDAVRGTVPFLMHQAMQTFKDEGVEEVSLCLMPSVGCDRRRPGDSWLIHTYLRITHRYLNFILDTPGLYHFKTRFRPRCDNVYCSVWPKSSLRPLHAMLSLWGTLQFSPWRAMRRGLRRFRIRRKRSTLVQS